MSSTYYTRRSGARNPNQPPQNRPLYNNFVKSSAPNMQANSGPAAAIISGSASGSVGSQSAPLQRSPQPVSGNIAANIPAAPVEVKPPVDADNASPAPEISENVFNPVDEVKVEDIDGQLEEKSPRWLHPKKKFGNYKPDKKQKKRRLNARLEKVLKPKNAFLIFNELNLKPEYEIRENVVKNQAFGRTYTAFLKLEDQMYSGESTTIAGAKMVAADVALKDWFLKSFRKAEAAVPIEKMETEQNGVPVPEPAPWSAVGSYAMHLLFARWQMDPSAIIAAGSGNVSDEGKISNSHVVDAASPPKNLGGKAPAIVSELVNYVPPESPKFPPTVEKCHPLYVFNLAFPNVPMVEVQDEANADTRFITKCKFNAVVYEARARNKKESRRQLVMQILKTYGIEFLSN